MEPSMRILGILEAFDDVFLWLMIVATSSVALMVPPLISENECAMKREASSEFLPYC